MPVLRLASLLLLFTLVALGPQARCGTAQATEGGDAFAGIDACKTAHAGCIAACESLEKDSAARAGCQARCATDRAVCEAEDSLDGLSDQAERLRGFLEGLTDDGSGGDGSGSGTRPRVTEEACAAARHACTQNCATRHGDNQDALAGCAGRCVADHAFCQAQARMEALTPELEREIDRWGRFLEGFLDQKGGFARPDGDGSDPGGIFDDFFAPPEPNRPPDPRPDPRRETDPTDAPNGAVEI